MNLLLFAIALIASFIVVRIGAIAFELTGLEWSLAKFQSLSCFTSTGFTTKEAELITGNPQRRRIASVLIILGNAGLVTLIATFANSLRPNLSIPEFNIPFVHLVVPSRILPWVNLTIIVITVFVTYKIFTRTALARKITRGLRNRIIKKEIITPVSFEELVVATGGYGISSIDICEDSPLLDKTLQEADLRTKNINILVIERGEEAIPNPRSDTKMLLRDRLICFGKLEEIREKLYTVPQAVVKDPNNTS